MPDQESATRECPFCKEEVKAEAVRCKHCQAAIPPERPSHQGVCPYCKEDINLEAIRCKHCKANLDPASSDAGCEGCAREARSALGQRLGGLHGSAARIAVPKTSVRTYRPRPRRLVLKRNSDPCDGCPSSFFDIWSGHVWYYELTICTETTCEYDPIVDYGPVDAGVVV